VVRGGLTKTFCLTEGRLVTYPRQRNRVGFFHQHDSGFAPCRSWVDHTRTFPSHRAYPAPRYLPRDIQDGVAAAKFPVKSMERWGNPRDCAIPSNIDIERSGRNPVLELLARFFARANFSCNRSRRYSQFDRHASVYLLEVARIESQGIRRTVEHHIRSGRDCANHGILNGC
jgi:hypothetical protein